MRIAIGCFIILLLAVVLTTRTVMKGVWHIADAVKERKNESA